MLGLDVAALTSLTKLLFDGLAMLVIILLYIRTNNNREKERKEERERYNQMVDDIITGVHNAHLTRHIFVSIMIFYNAYPRSICFF